MENTTETRLDIDSAVDLLVQPEEENLDTSDAEDAEFEEVEEDTEVDDSSEDDEDDSEEASDDAEDDSEEDVEDEDEDADESDDDSEQLFTVKIDGTEKAVTLEELKRGYSGQQYVQQGMQQAAEVRKQNEALYNTLLAERQQVAQLYQQLQSGEVATPPQPPSRELFDSDPIGYMEAKLQYDEQVQVYQKQQEQFNQLSEQQTQAQQAALQAYMQQELQALTQKVPELADPKSAPKVKEQLLQTGQEYGFTAEEVAGIMDSRAVHVLRDAMKYREILAGKKKADEKANPAKRRSKPVKAGAKRVETNGRKLKEQKARLRSSGSIDDALSLILNS